MWHHLRCGKDPHPHVSYGHGDPDLYANLALAGDPNVADRKHGAANPLRLSRPLRRGREEGSAAIEAAIVLPVLLLAAIGSVEFGRGLWTYHTMLLAVEEAGRYAMVYAASPSLLTSASCPGAASVTLRNCATAKANAYLAAYDGATGISVASTEDSSTPPNLTITATYTFNFIDPILLPFGPITLSSKVVVPTL
jgi:Flp pilus assembly protein TadG